MSYVLTLVCDDIVQLTLMLVPFKTYAITLDGESLGTVTTVSLFSYKYTI